MTAITPEEIKREKAARAKYKRMLRRDKEIHCLDAKSHIGLLSLALEMAMRGETVKAKIVRGY